MFDTKQSLKWLFFGIFPSVLRERRVEALGAAVSEGRGRAEAPEREGTSGGAQPGESAELFTVPSVVAAVLYCTSIMQHRLKSYVQTDQNYTGKSNLSTADLY